MNRNFELQKIKLLPNGGGIDVHYTLTEQRDGMNFSTKVHENRTEVPTADLKNAVAALQPTLCSVLDVAYCGRIGDDPDFCATNEQKNALHEWAEAMRNRVTVTGTAISAKGNGDKYAVITGTLQCGNAVVGVASPRLQENERNGVPGDVLQAISEEVEAYLFDGKYQKLDEFNFGEEEE